MVSNPGQSQLSSPTLTVNPVVFHPEAKSQDNLGLIPTDEKYLMTKPQVQFRP